MGIVRSSGGANFMELPVVTETPSFLIGVIVGSLLLCLGLTLGRWLDRRGALLRDVRSLDREQLQHLLSGLFRWTSGFASDVSHYREVLERVSRQFPVEQAGVGDAQVMQVFTQIVHANEQLRERLNSAEDALRDQAQEIAGYMCEARTDKLTGLANRRAFDDELSRRLAECRRHESPLSILMLDIDHFKVFNDQFGHAAGDAVLSEVARVLNRSMRESDLVARLGGEEFAVILPSTDVATVCQAAERARRAVAQTELFFEGRMLRVTVSCGLAQATKSEGGAALLKRADHALYASKGAGRNASHWHDGRQCHPLTSRVAGSRLTKAKSPILDDPHGDFFRVCDDLRQRLLDVTQQDR